MILTLYFTFQLERDFAFGLYELDYDVFGVHIEGAVNRVPCLENVSTTTTTTTTHLSVSLSD